MSAERMDLAALLLIGLSLVASGAAIGACGSGGAGSTDSGGGSSGPGATGTGGNPFQGCPGIKLESDGVLDLDIPSFEVKGTVRLAGKALPAESDDRGTLVFVEQTIGARATVDLGSNGAVDYTLSLPPGTYEVRLVANGALCSGAKAPAVPCLGGVVKSGVVIGSDGVLDVDIPAATVQGAIKLARAPFPGQAGSRGHIGFRSSTGETVELMDLGASGPAAYALTVVPGTYAVSFFGNPDLCAGMTPPAVPCNAGDVIAASAIPQSGILDVDIGAAAVKGNVTVNGKPIPSQPDNRGQLTFSQGADWIFSATPLGSSGVAAYAVTLLPGTYTIGFDPNAALCPGTTAPAVPCVSGAVKTSVAITTSGALNVDLPAVKVSGAVTLAGKALPSGAEDRGSLLFTLVDGGTTELPLGTSGAVSYATTLLRGTYAVSLGGNTAACSGGVAPEVPCIDGPLRSPLAIGADGVLDVDIGRVKVSGDVKLMGGPLPDEAADRGRIIFSLQGGGAAFAPLDLAGPVKYALTLLPGTYAVALGANDALCAGGTSSKVPCGSGPLQAPLALTSDGVLDLDIPAVHVSGAVTRNGGALPGAANGNRGAIGFTRLGDDGSTIEQPLQDSGAGSYAVTLIPGAYVVTHAASPTACTSALGSKIPCASQVLRGCTSSL